MTLPLCCGKEMKVVVEVGRFKEVKCVGCGDIVYIKKYATQKPVMIDD